MLKKIFFLLLCTNLCASEKPEGNSSFRTAVAAGAIGLGSAVFLMLSSNSEVLEAYSRLSGEDAKKILALGRAGISIAATAAGAFATARLYPIGKEIYESTFPSEEQKKAREASIIASSRRLALFKAEGEFRECLLSSKLGSEKNASGVPSACEEAARMLELLGAESEVARMTQVFQKYRK